MDELLNWIERLAPGSTQHFEGFYDDQLEELEAAFRHPLPDVFRAFSKTMGENAGELLREFGLRSPNHVAELYREELLHAPRRFFFAFGDPSVSDQHVWLDRERPTGHGDYGVVRFSDHGGGWNAPLRWFASMRELLFFRAGLVYGVERRRYQPFMTPPPPARTDHERPATPFGELGSVLSRMGFSRSPHVAYCGVYERNGDIAAFYRSIDRPEAYSLSAGLDDEHAYRSFVATLEAETSLSLSPLRRAR